MKHRVTEENIAEEKEGIRVEVQNPSPTSEDKKSYGVEINLDKPKAERTYNGYFVTDSVRDSPVKPTQGGFLAEGNELPTDTKDKVTYKPNGEVDLTKIRQTQFNYESTKEDREHINNIDTGKTTLAWQGKYTEDNPNNKMFKGENFEVTVGVNPYPNENNQLNLIQIEGEKTVDKVLVKNQYVVTGARISNLTSTYYDETAYEDVTVDESSRITGVVLHPREDIVVEGAEAILVTAKNLAEMGTNTGDDTLTVGQIIFKMPTGALEDKNSIFNDDKFKGLQNLRARFYARPRTKEEFEALANGLKSNADDTSFGYVSTGAGTRTITHNGEEITIDKQGIARYDHYNLIGEMTINLDDTKYYDQSFKGSDGKDTEEHTSSKVRPGESFEVNMYMPEGDAAADNQKTADQMNASKAAGEAVGEINLDFVNVENKRIAQKLGTTVEKLTKDQKWDVQVTDGDISGFTITPSKTATPGEFVAVSIEYTYTNGSKDVHWFHFVVQDSDNNRPEYKAEVGYQGDTLSQTPELPQTEEALKKNQPKSYKLKPNAAGKFEYKDDRGNIWTDVAINPETGEVTAVVPENADIAGGENIFVPVIVEYEETDTGETKTEEVTAQFIARPKYTAGETKEVLKDIPFETKVIYDENLDAGTRVVDQEGTPGSKTTETTCKIKNGAQDGEPTTKEISKTGAVNRKVRVGIKPVVKKVDIPFDTEYEADPTLESGKIEEVTPGANGKKTITTKFDKETGKLVVSEEDTPATNRKVKVGTKTDGTHTYTEEIPFKVIVKEDSTLEAGKTRAEGGTVGKKEVTVTIETSQVVGDPVEKIVTESVDKIIYVGTKPTEDMCPVPENPTEPGEEDPSDPTKPGTGEENPETPGKEDPEKTGTGEENPETPGTEDPNKPETGEEDPEIPGTEDPETPGTEGPEKPGTGEEEPEKPGKEDPTKPGTGEEDSETPGTENPTKPSTGGKDSEKSAQNNPKESSQISDSNNDADKQVDQSAVLPKTGVAETGIFTAASLAILSGLGLVSKKEDDEA